jgi:hypothetical protein
MVGMIDFSQVDPNGANALARGFMASQDRQNQLQQQVRANKLADLQYSSALRGENNALAEEQVYRNTTDAAQLPAQLRAAGLGKQATAAEKSLMEQRAAQVTHAKGIYDLTKTATGAIVANPTLATATAALQGLAQTAGVDVSRYAQELNQIGENPEAIRAWAAGHSMDADKLLPKFQHFDNGGAVVTGSVDPLTGKFVQGQAFQKVATPGEVMTNDRMVSEGAKNRANAMEIAKTRISRTGAQGLTPLEDDALAQAILDGRVDINKVNSRNAKLLSAAVVKDPTANLKEMSFENAGAAAGSRALGTQSAKMVAASSEAAKMIPIAQNYVTKVNPSDYPIVNAAGNYVASKTGDPNVAGLAATLNALVNSYSRAINPTGNPTVSDKNHAREIINSAMAKGQFNEVFTVMQQEMDAAKASPSEAAGILKGQRDKPAPAAAGIDALLNKYK